MYKILVTGAGGGGGENLIASLRKSSLDLELWGSNMDPYLLAKSSADRKIHLPPASEPGYLDVLTTVLSTNRIDLVIPNNDTEVSVVSKYRDSLPCTVFLPPHDVVSVCQDKLEMHRMLAKEDIPQAVYKGLESFDDIDGFMDAQPAEKYWIRPRKGSGSRGATWVCTAGQARAWIKLWIELRGYKLTDFIISEFLPGRDYAFQSVWKDGEMVVGKMVERLRYVFGQNMLSGMSSSPSLGQTLLDLPTFENVIRKAILAVSHKPHGNYNLDLKGRVDGTMCVTEFNIGRFCMITPIFDLTGAYNTAEMHVKSALNLPIHIDDPLDFEDGCYLIRELDTKPTLLRKEEFEAFISESAIHTQAEAR